MRFGSNFCRLNWRGPVETVLSGSNFGTPLVWKLRPWWPCPNDKRHREKVLDGFCYSWKIKALHSLQPFQGCSWIMVSAMAVLQVQHDWSSVGAGSLWSLSLYSYTHILLLLLLILVLLLCRLVVGCCWEAEKPLLSLYSLSSFLGLASNANDTTTLFFPISSLKLKRH